MSSKRLFSFAATALLIALLGACSVDSLTDRAVEFGLEQAIESEGDIDLDLDFDGDGQGGFSISTDEGDFSFNLDGESGGIVFDTDEGDGVISFDEDGIVFDTDEGDGVISFDEDGIVFDTDEGDGVISFDDGGVSFGSSDGTALFGSGEVPADWPAEIGVPATAQAEETFFTVIETGDGVAMTGVFQHDPAEDFGGQVKAALEATGWTPQFDASTPGSVYSQFTRGNVGVLILSDGTGFTSISVVPET